MDVHVFLEACRDSTVCFFALEYILPSAPSAERGRSVLATARKKQNMLRSTSYTPCSCVACSVAERLGRYLDLEPFLCRERAERALALFRAFKNAKYTQDGCVRATLLDVRHFFRLLFLQEAHPCTSRACAHVHGDEMSFHLPTTSGERGFRCAMHVRIVQCGRGTKLLRMIYRNLG